MLMVRLSIPYILPELSILPNHLLLDQPNPLLLQLPLLQPLPIPTRVMPFLKLRAVQVLLNWLNQEHHSRFKSPKHPCQLQLSLVRFYPILHPYHDLESVPFPTRKIGEVLVVQVGKERGGLRDYESFIYSPPAIRTCLRMLLWTGVLLSMEARITLDVLYRQMHESERNSQERRGRRIRKICCIIKVRVNISLIKIIITSSSLNCQSIYRINFCLPRPVKDRRECFFFNGRSAYYPTHVYP